MSIIVNGFVDGNRLILEGFGQEILISPAAVVKILEKIAPEYGINYFDLFKQGGGNFAAIGFNYFDSFQGKIKLRENLPPINFGNLNFNYFDSFKKGIELKQIIPSISYEDLFKQGGGNFSNLDFNYFKSFKGEVKLRELVTVKKNFLKENEVEFNYSEDFFK